MVSGLCIALWLFSFCPLVLVSFSKGGGNVVCWNIRQEEVTDRYFGAGVGVEENSK